MVLSGLSGRAPLESGCGLHTGEIELDGSDEALAGIGSQWDRSG
jgi:hypothetical protein